MKKIVIVKTSALGDIIHSYPLIHYLKSRYPEVLIDWIVERPFQALVSSHPAVRRTLTIDSKCWRKALFAKETRAAWRNFKEELQEEHYDLAIDLQGNLKSALVLYQTKADVKLGFGIRSVPEWPNLLFTNRRFNPMKGGSIQEDYLSIVKQYFDDHEPWDDPGVELEATSPMEFSSAWNIMVCPGSAWPNKMLSKATWKAFLSEVAADASVYFVWGSKEERSLCEDLATSVEKGRVLEKMPLNNLQAAMRQMDEVFAVDSLALHLGASAGTRTFSVFGASLASKYAPRGEKHTSIQGSCPYGKRFEKRCPILRSCETGACIKDISKERLVTQYRQWTKRAQSPHAFPQD